MDDVTPIIIGFVDDYPTYKSLLLVCKNFYHISKKQTKNPIRTLMRFWKLTDEDLFYQNPWLEPEVNQNLRPNETNFDRSDVRDSPWISILENGRGTIPLRYFSEVISNKYKCHSKIYYNLTLCHALTHCTYSWEEVVCCRISIAGYKINVNHCKISVILKNKFGL